MNIKKVRFVLFCIANGHIQQSTEIEITKSVSPSISDQSGSDPGRRALFIMFNGVNTLLLIRIQSRPRAFLWEMQLPIYGLGHYQKCLYQHHYDPHYDPWHNFTKVIFPIALILEQSCWYFSHS